MFRKKILSYRFSWNLKPFRNVRNGLTILPRARIAWSGKPNVSMTFWYTYNKQGWLKNGFFFKKKAKKTKKPRFFWFKTCLFKMHWFSQWKKFRAFGAIGKWLAQGGQVTTHRGGGWLKNMFFLKKAKKTWRFKRFKTRPLPTLDQTFLHFI